MSFQTTVIAGNLGRDPEIRHTNDGKPVANFSVAVSDYKDNTTWFRCVAFGKTAEFVGQYLTKGDKVVAEGRIQEREWTTQDGEVKKTWELVTGVVRGLGSKRDKQDGGSPAPLDDEIPFRAEWR